MTLSTIWSRPEPANGLGGCRSMSICSILVSSPWNRLAIFQGRVAKSYPHLFVPNRSELSVAVKANNAKAAKSKVDTSPQHYVITCLAIPDWAISTTFPWMHVARCRVFTVQAKFWTCCKSSTYQRLICETPEPSVGLARMSAPWKHCVSSAT